MSKLSQRVSFSSDHGTAKPAAVARNRKRVIAVFWVFRLPKSAGFSPGNFLRRIGAKVAKVLRFVSLKKRSSKSSKNNKGSGLSSGSGSDFNRSHSVSDSMEESHRAEAVKDCIQFFNSSSTTSSAV